MIYRRKVHYYETDKMGIVHHSNHVRWLEEMRLTMLDEVGFPYKDLERRGIIIPVLDVQIHYAHPAHYADIVDIEGNLREFTGLKFSIDYSAHNQEGNLLLTARTMQGFLDEEFKPLRLKRTHPDVYAAFELLLEMGTRG